MIAASHEAWVKLGFAAAAFIITAMAMVVLVWRDRRPRADTWHTIVRSEPLPPPPLRRRSHTRSYEHRHFDVREHEDEREP